MATMPRLTGPARQRLILGVIALGFGAFALISVNNLLSAERRKLAAERKKLLENYQSPVDVVVAKQDLPDKTFLEPDMLAFAKVPERFAQPYSVRDPGQVVGLVTVAPIAAGEQVLTNKLQRKEEVRYETSLSSVVPKGKRAVTITVNTLTGVGGFVRPGDVVDVLWTLTLPNPHDPKNPELVTLTLFQDVPVMAIKHEMLGQGPAEPAVESTEGEGATKASPPVAGGEGEYTATLALTPQEISFLLFAREQGRIQLSLRPQEEEAQVAIAPVNMTTMLGATLGPEALKASQPVAKRQIEIYKGLTRDVVVLPETQAASE